MNHSRPASLRFYLTALVLLALLPLVVLIFNANYTTRQREIERSKQDVLRLAQVVAMQEQELFETTRQLLVALAQVPTVKGGDAAACRAFLHNLLARYQRYANFGVIAADGQVTCSAVAASGISLAGQDYFRQALSSGDFSLGDYQIDPITQRAVIPFAYPLDNTTAPSGAVIFALLDTAWLNQTEVKVDSTLSPDATLTKIDARGQVLLHEPDPATWEGRDASDQPLVRIVLQRQEGVVQMPGLDGVNAMQAFVPLSSVLHSLNVYVIVGIPPASAFADSKRLWLQSLLISILTLLAALTLAKIVGDRLILAPLSDLVHVVQQWAAGNLNARVRLQSGPLELQQFGDTTNVLAEMLGQRERELNLAFERLRTLSHRLIHAQEDERRYIAGELHDEIGQALTSVKISLQRAQNLHDKAAIDAFLDDALRVAEHALQQVRNLSFDLRPSLLDDLGLVSSLRWLVDRQSRRAGFVAVFRAEGSNELLIPAEVEIACYRIVQEALTNAIRHAQATHVQVMLRINAQEVVAMIQDNGRGFDVQKMWGNSTDAQSMGLVSMEERVTLAGGKLRVSSAIGRGTEIHAIFPLSRTASDDLSSQKKVD